MVPFPVQIPLGHKAEREIGVVSAYSIGLSRQNMPVTGAIRLKIWLSFKEGPLFIGDTDTGFGEKADPRLG